MTQVRLIQTRSRREANWQRREQRIINGLLAITLLIGLGYVVLKILRATL